jgi:hypothetical protein
VGKKMTFDCFLVRQSTKFGDSRQPALFYTSELNGFYKAIGFLPESKVFGKICPTQDENQSSFPSPLQRLQRQKMLMSNSSIASGAMQY